MVITAGTVIRFIAVDTETPSASVGTFSRATVSGNTNPGLSGNEESVYAYQAATASEAPTVFLSAICNKSFGTTVAGVLTNTGLSIGNGALQTGFTGGSDFAEYNVLFNEFLELAAHFRNKKFIPQSRRLMDGVTVEWMVPAYCGVADPDAQEKTVFYRDKWLALEAKMNQLADCAYVHAKSGRAQSVVTCRIPATGETVEHNLTRLPVMGGEAHPYAVYNPHTSKVETHLLHVDGQGLQAVAHKVVPDPKTTLDYKRQLMAMVLESF